MNNSILNPYLTKSQIQQHTPEWEEKRESLVTASKAAGLLECSSYGPYISDTELKLLNINDYNNRISNNAATDFGTQFENSARKDLEMRLSTKIYELGLAVHSLHSWLGASPDGIFSLDRENALKLGIEIKDAIPCLIEIKCPFTRQINYKIPMEYWVQMQIQLEVWDLEYVLYSENEYSKEDGKLLKSWDTLVKRDKEWFQKVLPILQQNKQRLTKEQRYFWSNAVNPNQIRNWIANDPILDWLDRYSYLDSINLEKDPIKKYDLAKFASKQTKLFHNEILKYFNNANINFVNIALNWYNKIKPTTDTSANLIQESTIHKSYAKYAMTLKAIQDCVPVITDAILINEKTNRWGKADLLVREDYLEHLFSNNSNTNDNADNTSVDNATTNNTSSTADNVASTADSSNGKKRKWTKNNQDNAKKQEITKEYKYYVVLTRFASLRLTADGVHMLNEPKQKLYKSYVGFLTDCLPLNVKTSYGYIIGRKSSWTSKGISYKKDGFSKSLGKISLNDKDSFVTTLIEDGINWLTRLKEDGMNWSLKGEAQVKDLVEDLETDLETDLEKEKMPARAKERVREIERARREKRKAPTSLVKPIELFPNMKNKNDYPWHTIKKRIAKESEEITEILNIGPEKRNNMVMDGIFKWSDIEEEDLHTYKISEKECVNNILTANKQNIIIGIDRAKEILEVAGEIECYVDFETVTDLNESIGEELFDTSPGIKNSTDASDKQGQSNIIYMIGCLIRNNKTKKGEYFNYLIKTINPDNEKKVIIEWLNDLNKALNNNNLNNKTNMKIPIYHWSPAEVVQLRRVKKEYGLTPVILSETISSFIDKMHFIDLYQVFKEAKVGIPGAFGYGLKTVAKALYNLGKIKNTWEENLNGADAMVAAWYLNNLNCNNIGRLDDKVIAKAFDPTQPTNLEDLAKEIILYNYYDCKVMEEIAEYIRSV